MKSSLIIGLLWHTDNAGNLGLGALTEGHLTIMGRAVQNANVTPRYIVFQGKQAGEHYVNGIERSIGLSNLDLLLPNRFIKWLRSVDCIIDIGEGDGFSDIYGPKRLARQLFTKILSRFFKIPYIIAPQTVGPLNGRIVRLFSRVALVGARSVVARDRISAMVITSIAPTVLPLIATDVAFAMSATRKLLPNTEKIRIGLNISGLLSNKRSKSYRISIDYDYISLLTSVAGMLSIDDRYEIYLIGHVFSNDLVDDDGRIISDWMAKFPRFKAAPAFRTPREAKGFIAAMDVVIASRMHACIAALSSGVPVIPISYSAKFEGLFATLNYNWVIPHSGMSINEAVVLINSALNDLPRLRRDAVGAQHEAERRLFSYEQMLTIFFGSLVTRTGRPM